MSTAEIGTMSTAAMAAGSITLSTAAALPTRTARRPINTAARHGATIRQNAGNRSASAGTMDRGNNRGDSAGNRGNDRGGSSGDRGGNRGGSPSAGTMDRGGGAVVTRWATAASQVPAPGTAVLSGEEAAVRLAPAARADLPVWVAGVEAARRRWRAFWRRAAQVGRAKMDAKQRTPKGLTTMRRTLLVFALVFPVPEPRLGYGTISE